MVFIKKQLRCYRSISLVATQALLPSLEQNFTSTSHTDTTTFPICVELIQILEAHQEIL
jgi:hypothetical protein